MWQTFLRQMLRRLKTRRAAVSGGTLLFIVYPTTEVEVRIDLGINEILMLILSV
jgi:hypothetical protein